MVGGEESDMTTVMFGSDSEQHNFLKNPQKLEEIRRPIVAVIVMTKHKKKEEAISFFYFSDCLVFLEPL